MKRTLGGALSERIMQKPLWVDRALAVALAASIGFHGVAAWGASWWRWTNGHREAVHVISLRLMDDLSAPTTTTHSRRRSSLPARSTPTPSRKRVEPPKRATPSSAARKHHPRKTLIAQKLVPRGAPSEPPRPIRSLAVAKNTITPPATDHLLPTVRRAEPPATEGPTDGVRREELLPKPSSVPQGSPALAKAEPLMGEERAARLETIRKRIQRALVYPAAARRFGWEGTARVRLVLAPDGHLDTVQLESSSQLSILDREAVAAVRRAQPYPYVEGPILVPIVFDLRNGGL